jgi:hypothetical protein
MRQNDEAVQHRIITEKIQSDILGLPPDFEVELGYKGPAPIVIRQLPVTPPPPPPTEKD